jgi:uncharacterized protein (TIGR02284 family)
MALETTSTLDSTTISHLQTLARLNIDSRDGFVYAASKLPHESLAIRELFDDAAQQRGQLADELNKYVDLNDSSKITNGSVSASLHRSLMALRDLFSSEHDPYAVLAEAERGEDVIKTAYETALKECTGSAVTSILNHQYALVKSMHDKIRELRDQHASS